MVATDFSGNIRHFVGAQRSGRKSAVSDFCGIGRNTNGYKCKNDCALEHFVTP
jgi:hypothetical protein